MLHRKTIQEGVLCDLVDLISDATKDVLNSDSGSPSMFNRITNDGESDGNYFRSISRKASNLILTFPLIVDDSVSIDTASMTAKAVEKKIILMLQMLFSAISVTNNKDAFDFVSKFHKNLTSDDVLSYINRMDSIPYKHMSESTIDLDEINKEFLRIMREDNIVLSNDIQPALESKKTKKPRTVQRPQIRNDIDYGAPKGQRARVSMRTSDYEAFVQDAEEIAKTLEIVQAKKDKATEHIAELNKQMKKYQNDAKKQKELEAQLQKELKDLKENQKKIDELKEKNADISSSSNGGYYIDTKLDQPELKKANEMVPSIMVIRFRSGDRGEACGEAVIGVKVKLVYVTQSDMIERILLKSGDQNTLFEFLKATTGEIAMFKDFMFALDRAKLDVFTRSAKSSPIWRLLERRANVNRANSWFRSSNGGGSAIATFLVSQDTIDILKKEHRLDVKYNIRKLIKIMLDYSAMGFIIANDVTEKIQMLFDDNSISFETLSYSSLEREDKNQYKKIINLLAGK